MEYVTFPQIVKLSASKNGPSEIRMVPDEE